MKRLLFASGGSGGHLAPAIALAQKCGQAQGVASIATTRKRVDQRMQEPYPEQRFVSFDSMPLTGSPFVLVRALLANLWGIGQALKFIHGERCEAVVATGGFGSVPPLLAASLLGIPFYLHDSNAILGKVTRWFSFLAQRVFVTRLMASEKALLGRRFRRTGFPVRSTFRGIDKGAAKQVWGMDAVRPVIGVLGGSQGAQVLTQLARACAPQWQAQGIQVVTIVGPNSSGPTEGCCDGPGIAGAKWVDFVDDMGCFLSAVDVLIARAGAGSIAEIAHAQCPAILVPLPSAADDHQRANARAFAASGCAWVVDEADLAEVPARVLRLLGEQETLARMKQAMQEWSAGNRMDGMLAECLHEEGMEF